MGDYDYRSTEDIYRHFKFRALRKYTSEIEMLTDVIDKEKRIRVLYKEACQLKKSNSSDEVILKWCYKNDFISCNENVVTDKELVYSFKRTLDFMYSDFRQCIPIHIVYVDARLYIDFLIEKKESLEQLEFNRFQREKYIKEQESFKKYDASVFKSELSFKIFKLFADRYVVDCYKDFSFIYHTMLSEDYIYKMKQSKFVDWLLTNNFISSSQREISRWDEGLSKKFDSFERLNFYQKVKEELGV